MAANLTKEQLKNELISHGVQPPSTNARKEEFVKLYEQHVAPIVSQKGDFSSDEENDINEETVKKAPAPINCENSNSETLDVTALSDEELFAQLQSFGVPVGPIVDTTRSIYQKKLAALLQEGNPSAPEQTNGNDHQVADEKFSDSEDEPETEVLSEEPEKDHSPTVADVPIASAPVPESSITSTPEPMTAIRKRLTERPPSSMSALPLVDRQGTPTPRPSIHSVSSSAQYTYETRRFLDTVDSSTAPQASASSSGASPKPKIIRYIVLLIVFFVAAYITYTYANINQVQSLMVNIKQKVVQYLEKAEEKVGDSSQASQVPDVA